MMKLRILNAGHAIIAYPSGLLDIHFVHEGMEHPLVRAFLQKVERDEIIPIVPPVPSTDPDAYFRKVEERCLNPKIGDTIRRLCLDGSNRQPKFIIPSIADRLAKGLPVDGLALESALWARYCAGTTDSGAVIEPNDPNWDRLHRPGRRRPRGPRRLARHARHLRRHRRGAGLPRRLRRLAPRPLVRRHRGDAPALPRMTTEVRDARPEEAAEIAALLRASIAGLCGADHRNDPAAIAAWTANKTPETVAAWIADPGQRLLVATCDGRLAGAASARQTGELLLLYVAPGATGRGCGSALLAATEAWLARRRRRRHPPREHHHRPRLLPRARLRRGGDARPPPRHRRLPDAQAPRPPADRSRHLRLRRRARRQRADLAPPAARDPRRRRGPPLARRGRRALPRPLARLDPRDRRPRVRRHRQRRSPRRHAPRPLRRLPRRARADPPHRRDPRRAALRLLRRLLLPARARRAVADRHRPLAALRRPGLLRDDGRERQARPRPLPFRRRNPRLSSRRLPRRRGQPGRHRRRRRPPA